MKELNLAGKKALIYSRVSTKEQMQTGYSLAYQEEQLIKFCKDNGIEILQSYVESHSAKSFDRPEFNKMLVYAMSNHKNIDLILTVKWDRFSREVSGTDIMLNELKAKGIIVNAITEWRDLDNTSDWVMHKIQMTMAEAENKIKRERVMDGNYKAYLEGRFINHPPLGYKSGKDELGKTLMQPDPEKAPLVTSLLMDYSTGNYSQNELLKKYNALGLKLSKSNLSRMLTNEVYAGLLKVKAYKGNQEQIVNALHQPLISESTFKRNQYFLDEKNRLKEKPAKDNENLPLRGGILVCPNCGRNLTGYTKTKPSGKQYHYYKCESRLGCNFSCNATKANDLLVHELNAITPSPNVIELFKQFLMKKYNSMFKDREQELSAFNKKKVKSLIGLKS